jgi:acetyltransferase-like isoleucine patch superfamily enzyme
MRVLFSPIGRMYLTIHGAHVGRKLRLQSLPFCRCYGTGRIEIGDNVTILNTLYQNTAGIVHKTVLIAGDRAILRIGNDVGISGAILDARDSISIGDRCMLGANCSVFSSDYHALHPRDRHDRTSGAVRTAPVTLENDVWIGANAVVLKGVTIGAASIVAAGSVVTKSVPPGVVVAGNPARVVKPVPDANIRPASQDTRSSVAANSDAPVKRFSEVTRQSAEAASAAQDSVITRQASGRP